MELKLIKKIKDAVVEKAKIFTPATATGTTIQGTIDNLLADAAEKAKFETNDFLWIRTGLGVATMFKVTDKTAMHAGTMNGLEQAGKEPTMEVPDFIEV